LSQTETSAPAPRKFVGPTSREALRLARQSLGSDAMVRASRAVSDGRFEVVAMAEGETMALVRAATVPPAGLASAASAALSADTVLSELHSMRSMIEERLGSVAWNDQQRRDPVRGRLLRTMLGAGFSARLSKAMLEHLPAGQSYAAGLGFVRAELTRALPIQEDEDAMWAQGGTYALVGPTGVGKTTTTAKLAARCVMRFGADKLALVTTDGYRIGAYEQLRIYGQILGVPVHAVKDAANLQAVLEELREKHTVLIDTVGMSQRDRAVADQIGMLCSAGRPVKRLLLLNAASHGDTLNEVVYAYQNAGHGNGLAGCIFTKLDEATTHGALLDTVIRHRLPVHYLSNGQNVPEHLITVNRAQLVEDVLKAPPPGALFVCDPDLGQGSPPGAPGDVARARAQTDRLRLQYQQLIRAMAHDAQEIASSAKALEACCVGFSTARALWACAADDTVSQEATLQHLLEMSRAEAAKACDSHVLAVCGRASLDPDDHGGAFDLRSTLLLSDRDGCPFAAPGQWLADGTDQNAGLRQTEWLWQQDFGTEMVHVLARLPARPDLFLLAAQGRQWLARANGSTVVVDSASGDAVPLWRLQVDFGPEQALSFRGKAAVRVEGETRVRMQGTDGAELTLRCVVRRTVHAESQRTLEQTFLLANVAAAITTGQLTQWQAWGSRADSCFRLTGKGLALLGGVAEAGGPSTMKRLLIAGQVATSVWRLLQVDGERAERTRVMLTELAGRQVRSDRPQSGSALYEGLAKLFHLLEALSTDGAAETGSGSLA
jgi:flagellar biosynthesis protein FlhF